MATEEGSSKRQSEDTVITASKSQSCQWWLIRSSLASNKAKQAAKVSLQGEEADLILGRTSNMLKLWLPSLV